MTRVNFAGPLIAKLWSEGRVADLPDSALIGRFVAGDHAAAESAFEAIMARHGPMVMAVCRASNRDRGSAEDAFQATFTVLVRRARALQRSDRLGPWLHGVALRTSKEAARRARRRTPSDPLAEPTDGSISVVERLARREAVAALQEEIGRLPDSYRAPVVLCELQGLSHQEAASRLGVTTGALAVRVHRARKMLRERLSRRGVGASSLAIGGLHAAQPIDAAGRGLPTARTTLARASWSVQVGNSATQLAQGVLMTMTLRIFVKSALALLLLTASTAVVVLGLAFWTGPGWAASRSPMARVPVSDQTSKGDPKSSFDRVYQLGPGEVVKLIPPPFPTDRAARLKAMKLPESPISLIFTQLPDGAPTRLKWSTCFASDDSYSQRFIGLLQSLLSLDSFSQVEIHDDPIQTVAGDWIIRQGASRAEVLAGLNTILSEQFQPALRISVRPSDEERDVIVARGRYARKLITEGMPKNDAKNQRIFLFATPGTPERFRMVGTFEHFLFNLSTFLEPKRVILSEAEGIPDGVIGWEAHAASPTEGNVDGVLKHLTQQTGLEFVSERRKIPVYHLERAEP
jgi:RNA polymerase sigma factor (sigma-70 family)